MSLMPGDMSEVAEIPDTLNIRYILRGTRLLTLLVNLKSKAVGYLVAQARSARIEDMPLLLDLTVGIFGGAAEANLEAAALVKSLISVGPNTSWVVDDTILKIIIDLSPGPDSSNKNAIGDKTTIASIRANSKIGESKFRVTMRLFCEGGVKWPLMLSPRSGTECTDEASSQGLVARALEFTPSASIPRAGYSPYVHNELYELSESITLDLAMLPIARLRINMDGKDGRLVRYTGDIFSGVGISLSVEFQSKGVSPLAGNRAPMSRKRLNTFIREERGPAGEPILIIEFDTTKDFGESTVKRRVISDATRVIVNKRFKVNFAATGPPNELPSFADMYRTICKFLDPMPNPLLTLNMPDVRMFVAKEYPRFGMTREIKNLVWEAVRLYVVNDYMPQSVVDVSVSPSPLRVS
ncbi:uncharacterized protein TM35_000113120 [Trypanosoma theileri]|uniref:Uncharacterized protein n=1 Tax=Trypanosoma theileri TaxID=67003 RepID=A0A1X0NZ01_9TRYP|nr:uncharacterized protein TM35_000113120 [Trypanosoma theileri]ORC89778.1 hypothetical protein TM35_000113120 [Trypanosoma theileri]